MQELESWILRRTTVQLKLRPSPSVGPWRLATTGFIRWIQYSCLVIASANTRSIGLVLSKLYRRGMRNMRHASRTKPLKQHPITK